MIMQNPQPDTYGFSAEPRVVQPRSKYRDVPQDEPQSENRNYTNIMYDKRVVKGNTYAAIVTTSREAAQQLRSTQPKPRRIVPKPTETGEAEAITGEVNTPRALDGRKHVELQTDENVELLTDKPPVYEKDAQTDFYIERPVPRHYMPVKTGEDRETQIWDGELFNFDHEVEPILQVLIGKTFEQSRMEVLEEEELRVMRDEQRRYDELRYAEMLEGQRLEAVERRQMEENERRKKEHNLKKESIVNSHKKLVSRVLAKGYLKNISANTLGQLAEQGLFTPKLKVELNGTYAPWLYNETVGEISGRSALENFLDFLNEQFQHELSTSHKKAVDEENERRRIAKEERDRLEAEKQRIKDAKAEARRKREEQKRRDKLMEQIEATLFAKAEARDKIFAQVLSDIDSHGKDGGTVGLLGGVIGELLILFSTIEDLKKDEENKYVQNLHITEDTVQDLLDRLIGEIVEGVIEIGVSPDLEGKLAAIDESLNLETLFTLPDKKAEIQAALLPSIKSYLLNFLRKNLENLGLREHLLEWIINGVVRTVLSPEDNARKIKLVNATQSYKNKEPAIIGIVSTQPNLEGAPEFGIQEKKLPEKNAKTISSKGSIVHKSTSQLPDPADTDRNLVELDPAQVDYEDRVTVFPLMNEELRVLVNHRPASIILRRHIILFLKDNCKDLNDKVIELLKKVNHKANFVEDYFTKSIADNFPVLPFDMQ